MLGFTGCEKIEEFMNNSTVTIAYSYPNESNWLRVSNYYDLTITIDDKKYNSIGTYTVPVGTVIKLSWKWNGMSESSWVKNQSGNAEVLVDSYKNCKVTIAGSQILIDYSLI